MGSYPFSMLGTDVYSFDSVCWSSIPSDKPRTPSPGSGWGRGGVREGKESTPRCRTLDSVGLGPGSGVRVRGQGRPLDHPAKTGVTVVV